MCIRDSAGKGRAQFSAGIFKLPFCFLQAALLCLQAPRKVFKGIVQTGDIAEMCIRDSCGSGFSVASGWGCCSNRSSKLFMADYLSFDFGFFLLWLWLST